MHHTCLMGNRWSCISCSRHGFRSDGNLRSRLAVRCRRDRNTPGYLPAAREGNLPFSANFSSIRCGFPGCPSFAEGDEVASKSSGCRGPACEDRWRKFPT